jgi:thioredoxin-like negative regulator of GroEL
MFAILVASSLVVSELAVASVPGPDIVIEEQKPAAFAELSRGETQRAVTMLEAALQKDPGDPALLINLAYGYVKLGRSAEAATAYRAAAASRKRYELELASGRWSDSTMVARNALRSLDATVQVAALTRR